MSACPTVEKKVNMENTTAEAEILLPQNFTVKYLGQRDAGGLWGIKYTRRPVDELVAAAKTLRTGQSLPFLQLEVSKEGVRLNAKPENVTPFKADGQLIPIESISYGVQDLVYTRVFSMIEVVDEGLIQRANVQQPHPFQCHSFVCDSRTTARLLTLSLAAAFKELSKDPRGIKPVTFAIDLRSPDQLKEDLEQNDSEA